MRVLRSLSMGTVSLLMPASWAKELRLIAWVVSGEWWCFVAMTWRSVLHFEMPGPRSTCSSCWREARMPEQDRRVVCDRYPRSQRGRVAAGPFGSCRPSRESAQKSTSPLPRFGDSRMLCWNDWRQCPRLPTRSSSDGVGPTTGGAVKWQPWSCWLSIQTGGSDIWPDEIDPAAAVAHGLRVLLSVPPESPDLPIIRQMLQDAVYPQVRDYCFWFDLPAEDVAGYLLMRAFAQDLKLQNPVVQLAGLHIFPLEMPLDKLEALSGKVIAAMRANTDAWRLVEKRAEDFITPTRSEKLAALLPVDATGKTLRAPDFAGDVVPVPAPAPLAFFAKPSESSLGWTAELAPIRC